ncbi:MAG: class I SAM-dependent methyltransferase [Anaerolineae bacterium]|nr:class I SAM-dependent methyltransferase [Anaerolineae bacterium]
MQKRFLFAKTLLEVKRPKRVLDVGCGTGQNLTVPLAECFPETQFLGVDIDKKSIQYAQEQFKISNIRFASLQELPSEALFDFLIASEVIEHTEQPSEFLRFLSSHVNPSGTVLLTCPNGYGPFEFMALVEALLNVSGIQGVLRKVKHAILGKPQNTEDITGTLAVSPHTNFFTHREIRKLFAANGFTLEQYKARTFLCGYLIDSLLKASSVIQWNAQIANRLPAFMNSGWMFVLNKIGEVPNPYTYQRGYYARFRKTLNAKRWKIPLDIHHHT